MGMLATPEQQQALSRISGMMSLLEGHGDVTMNRAGAGEVPGAAHFSQVLHERRTQAHGLTRLDVEAARPRRQDAPVRRG